MIGLRLGRLIAWHVGLVLWVRLASSQTYRERSGRPAGTRENENQQRPWSINQLLCPPVLCGQFSASTTGKTGGPLAAFPFFEGDIVLDDQLKTRIGRERDQQLLRNVRHRRMRRRRRRRSIIRPVTRLWPYGIVPFVVDQGLSWKTRRFIKEAIHHIENYTCIRFRPKTSNDPDYIYYINQPGCWSYIGRKNGDQYISLGVGCENFGTVLHETVHSLGFWHEQSRLDRDRYVDILTSNIGPSVLDQFRKRSASESTSRGYAYDYESVTHYGPLYFSSNGKATVQVKGVGKKLKLKIGQRRKLSDLDIAQLRDMYHCNEKQAQRKACRDGWIKHGRSCYQFLSSPAESFAGAERRCRTMRSRLVHIESKSEDKFLKSHLINFYSKHAAWRTGGKKLRSGWVWNRSRPGRKQFPMIYTAWADSQPGPYSTLVLVRSSDSTRFGWQGTWAGSEKEPSKYTLPYICETKAKLECIRSKNKGLNYSGIINYTTKGITCQKWTSRYPHNHKYLKGKRSLKDRRRNGLGDHNYCRNPDSSKSRPWCYTTLSRTKWQYCDVKICK